MKKLATLSLLFFTYTTTQVYAKPEHVHGLHHKEGASGGLPQLDPSSFSSQTFWLIIIFVLIYLFFSFKTLPNISSVVENRAERIKNDLDSAAILKNEMEELQTSYEDNMNTTREESSLLFQAIENDIKAKTEEHDKSFQEYALDKTMKLEKSIEKARKDALEDLRDIATEVAITAAEKIIGIKTNAKNVKEVVQSISKVA